jgi:hypothetical protein
MQFKFHNGYPYILIYTDNLPEKFGGMTNAFIIRIRPKYCNDEPLKLHELHHIRMWWKHGLIGRLLYRYNRKYRLNEEIEAYKIQLKYSPQDFERFVTAICTKYNLNVTPEEIRLRLKS